MQCNIQYYIPMLLPVGEEGACHLLYCYCTEGTFCHCMDSHRQSCDCVGHLWKGICIT
jgi:hypothetical protein